MSTALRVRQALDLAQHELSQARLRVRSHRLKYLHASGWREVYLLGGEGYTREYGGCNLWTDDVELAETMQRNIDAEEYVCANDSNKS